MGHQSSHPSSLIMDVVTFEADLPHAYPEDFEAWPSKGPSRRQLHK
jgi:hypothetical protein